MAATRNLFALAVCSIMISTAVSMSIRVDPPSGCRDTSASCSRWARMGECVNNPNYMHVYCAESCDRCKVLDHRCTDRDLMCAGWAKNGECRRNKGFMEETCARSCNFCIPARDHTVPHVHMDIVQKLWKKYEQSNSIA